MLEPRKKDPVASGANSPVSSLIPLTSRATGYDPVIGALLFTFLPRRHRNEGTREEMGHDRGSLSQEHMIVEKQDVLSRWC
jgi:hypothetical protein